MVQSFFCLCNWKNSAIFTAQNSPKAGFMKKRKQYCAPEVETFEMLPYEEICTYGGGKAGDDVDYDDVEDGGGF